MKKGRYVTERLIVVGVRVESRCSFFFLVLLDVIAAVVVEQGMEWDKS